MAAIVQEAKERIPRTFQSDDYVARRDEIVGAVQRRRDAIFSDLAGQAREAGFLLQGNPAGFFLIPLAGDQPMDDQAFAALPTEERDALLHRRDQVMAQLRGVLKGEQGFEATAHERLAELQSTVATLVVDSLLDNAFEAYREFAEVVLYLTEVRHDMIDNIGLFQPAPPQAEALLPFGPPRDREPLRRYEVNLLVDCSDETCAPVIFEENPTPQHLLGRIEKEALFGAFTTDFTMIRPGSLHRANGGYLVLNFDDLLLYPLSWTELKRTLRTGQITVEELSERFGFMETRTVRPEPIPWTGKVVAIAREPVYRLLFGLDPDFRELFKVKADFDMHIDRTPDNEQAFAGMVASVTKKEGLPAFDRAAVARVIDEASRLAADHGKLSIRFGAITDIVREAAHWAAADGASIVGVDHVGRAVRERLWRINLIEEHIREAMEKGVIVVDTDGEAVGQVNGLSVVDLGDTAFGQPSRITATIGVGREGVLDLQREAQMSGPIHSKAVLTLQGFLVDRYAFNAPLALAARLSFEQSYGMIEGDSATCAEVCALLSRIAEVPIRQSLAITGSMDQKGEVQAIGGVNEKIEGFYDVCRANGLTGNQGVVIPATNVQHLMLREDVVAAIEAGSFKVHAVSTIDEALELLTGLAAGEKREDGSYPPESGNGRVMARLQQLAERLRASGDSRRPGRNAGAAASEPEEDA
jgi:lon-related putative ATP-dependent protease